ncbi:XRE family transcriptional regulator [Actinobacteria bacterium YIM 96077]|uniref:XRE family transcriptional regulator n=1 Tax=Phytoactinopolyspora halophila TaxID=1981511 RepID=A0A329R089_9ACTN|nr:XRE family transcriptional regulator [Phytoactinopolyspora halophila]AYY13195.1 XRE family transcriptional regulator [Actinobacteria bacterium YIM 96077]RAW17566.1 XRE family transcriptional regulator [Phytoactinopolyspora halophila]
MTRESALDIGDRLRAERLRTGISARALAREIGVSPSLISQIETGKSRPSVSTLYAITNVLGVSVEDLFERPDQALAGSGEPGSAGASAGAGVRGESPFEHGAAGIAAVAAAAGESVAGESVAGSGLRVTGPDRGRRVGPVVQPAQREVLTLDSGVTWERLGQVPGAHVDFLRITYEPGSTSAGNGRLMRHPGVEYGYVVHGELVLTLGFDEHRLVPGDAVSFDSTTPHGYRNDGMEPAVGIWFVLESL